MDDSSLQQTEMSMLMIEAVMENGARIPIYVNEARNSEKSIRPLQMVFQKETTETNKEEGDRLTKEIADLRATPYTPEKFPNVEIHFRGYITMIDGKVSYLNLNSPFLSTSIHSTFFLVMLLTK